MHYLIIQIIVVLRILISFVVPFHVDHGGTMELIMIEAWINFSAFLLYSGLGCFYPKLHLGEGFISLYITIMLVVYIVIHKYRVQLQEEY